MARISDKHHYASVVLSADALEDFEKYATPWAFYDESPRKHPHRRIGTLTGALLRVVEASWRIYRDKTGHMQLLVNRFDYMGGEGCSTHGEPKSLYTAASVSELLRRRLREAEQDPTPHSLGNDRIVRHHNPEADRCRGSCQSGRYTAAAQAVRRRRRP